jgi:agmatinase
MTSDFDPSAAARPGSGIFGLSEGPAEAGVHVLPVGFDATTSYRGGASHGPAAVLAASHQVELFDLQLGRPYEAGIHMFAEDLAVREWNAEARALAAPIHAAGGCERGDERLARIDAIGAELNAAVHARAAASLAEDKLVCLLGGDHSTPFGAIEACAQRHPGVGVLHFDAHADLRVAYEGFEWSHASILHNVTERIAGVSQIVQVGIRDLCEEELQAIEASNGRVQTLFDHQWATARLTGEDLRKLVQRTLEPLPAEVWITFDVDGLDRALCPNTGTPVPGGLLWHETLLWLDELAASGRRVVGLDLNEVSAGEDGDPEGTSWDAIVGARLLYRLIGTALATGRRPS